MNKKDRKKIIVILVVLVCLVGIFVFLRKNEDAEFMQEDIETEEEQMVLTSIDEADVTEIEFICGEDSFTLQRVGEAEVVDDTAEAENGAEGADAEAAEAENEKEADTIGWCFAGETDVDVDGSAVSSFLSNICALTAKQEIPEVENPEDYGITDASDTITIQLTDDLYVFRLGDYNSLASGYYITMNDNGSVYLIDSTAYYLLNKDRSYFVTD